MTTHRRRFLRLCGIAGAGALAGCSGSSDGSDSSGSPTPDQGQDATAPQLTVSLDFAEDGVTISHSGGDPASSLRVRYTADDESVVETWDPEGDIAAGASYTTERAPDPGTEVRLIWSEGDQSAVLAEETAPE